MKQWVKIAHLEKMLKPMGEGKEGGVGGKKGAGGARATSSRKTVHQVHRF